jgi:hypothetical protein
VGFDGESVIFEIRRLLSSLVDLSSTLKGATKGDFVGIFEVSADR